MIVHFICRGNAYRSRLAEAYLKSKKIPSLQVISSGIDAEIHRLGNGPISWYAMRIIFNEKLIPFMTFSLKQTTKKQLNNSDLVIFMSQSHFEYSQKNFDYLAKHFEVWNIPDVENSELKAPFGSKERSIEVINITEKTFKEIKKKVDDLIKKILDKPE